MKTADVARYVVKAIGQDERANTAIHIRVRASLARLEKVRKVVVKIGERHEARWLFRSKPFVTNS